MNFPDGAKSPWPPLYDLFVASIAFIAGFGKPSVNTVEVVAAIIPPLLGALTVIPVYFLARRLFDEKIALWGSFFFSLVRGHISYTFIGRPDHHAAEALISTLFILFFIASIQDYGKGKRTYVSPLLSGITLTAGLLVWTGSIIYIAIAVFASIALILKNQSNGISSTPVFYTISLSSLTAFSITSAYLLFTDTWEPLNYIVLSGFHALVVLFIFVFASLLGFISNFFLKRNIKWFYLVIASVPASIVVFALLFLLSPEFITSISDGIFKQIGKAVPWRKVISESRPLFSVMTVKGYEFSLDNAVSRAGWAILLVPFVFILMFIGKEKRDNAIFFALWSIPFLALTLNQMRYIYYFSVNIGIMTAYLMSKASRLSKSRQFAIVIPLVFMALFYSTLDDSIYLMKESGGENILNPWGKDAIKTMLWLRDKTPKTGYFMEAGKKPEYSIMSTWGFGHEITYISQRPVVANNFADVIKGQGYPDSLRYFTTTSVDESCSILERHNSRYVFITAPDYYSAMAAKMAGKRMPEYFAEDWEATRKALYEIVNFRLYFLDGKDIGRYRLVYESALPAYGSNRFKKYKVFEFVKGARIKGKGRPGSKVSVSLPIVSNQGREFIYENTVVAGKDGVFEIVLPYSTINTPYDVRAKEGYKLTIGGRIQLIMVNENAVLEGKEIYIR